MDIPVAAGLLRSATGDVSCLHSNCAIAQGKTKIILKSFFSDAGLRRSATTGGSVLLSLAHGSIRAVSLYGDDERTQIS